MPKTGEFGFKPKLTGFYLCANNILQESKNLMTIFLDREKKYLSTSLFN